MAALQELIFKKGKNWNDYPIRLKRGGLSLKKAYPKGNVVRYRWITQGAIWFSKERERLKDILPNRDGVPT